MADVALIYENKSEKWNILLKTANHNKQNAAAIIFNANIFGSIENLGIRNGSPS